MGVARILATPISEVDRCKSTVIDESLRLRTAKAATRFFKTLLREQVYQVKNQEGLEGTWGPMLLIEQGFLTGAKREWDDILPLWGNLRDPENEKTFGVFHLILEDSFYRASQETIDLLSQQGIDAEGIIHDYRNLGIPWPFFLGGVPLAAWQHALIKSYDEDRRYLAKFADESNPPDQAFQALLDHLKDQYSKNRK